MLVFSRPLLLGLVVRSRCSSIQFNSIELARLQTVVHLPRQQLTAKRWAKIARANDQSGWKPVKNNQWLSDKVREAKGPDNSKILRIREDDDTETSLISSTTCVFCFFARRRIMATEKRGQSRGAP